MERLGDRWDRMVLGLAGVALCVSATLPRWALYGTNLDSGTTAYISTLHRMSTTWVWHAWSIGMVVVGLAGGVLAVAAPRRVVPVCLWVIGCVGLAMAGGALIWANLSSGSVHVIPGVGSWLALVAGGVAVAWSWARTARGRASRTA